MARTEACIAAGRKQLSTHPLCRGQTLHLDPEVPGHRESGGSACRKTTCQDTQATEIPVAADGQSVQAAGSGPFSHTICVPQRCGMQQPPRPPWCQRGWWACVREVELLLSKTEFTKDYLSRITQVGIWRNQMVSPFANAEPWLPALGFHGLAFHWTPDSCGIFPFPLPGDSSHPLLRWQSFSYTCSVCFYSGCTLELTEKLYFLRQQTNADAFSCLPGMLVSLLWGYGLVIWVL